MTPEEKAVLEAALRWSHHEIGDKSFDGVVAAYRKSLEPQKTWVAHGRFIAEHNYPERRVDGGRSG